MLKKINSYIYFAFASKSIVLGESTIYKMAKNKVYLVILASDLSLNSQKKIIAKCEEYHVPWIHYETKDTLGSIINKGNVGIIGILNQGLAKAILQSAKEEN